MFSWPIGSHAPILREDQNLTTIALIDKLKNENYDETEQVDPYDQGKFTVHTHLG